jgi:hypothetical protein
MCTAALGLLGTAVQAFGQISAANAQGDALEYNAKVRDLEATQTTELGFRREEIQRRQGRKVLGQQLVDLAKAGVDTATGTPLLLAFDSAREAELEALKIRTDTVLRTDALKREAVLDRKKAKDVRKSGPIGAASTILGGFQQWSALG